MKIKLYHEKHQRDTLLFSIALILFSKSLTLETTAWATHPPGELNILGLVFKLMRYAAYFLALIKITIEKILKENIITI